MSSLTITGGYPVMGEVKIQGSKNAALPLLAASILIKGVTVLEHCPDISDVSCMLEILKSLGCTVVREAETVIIDAGVLEGCTVKAADAKKMRSSITLLGALLGRQREAQLPLPGGCSIGKRPIDLHLSALRRIGAEITETEELHARLAGSQGAEICFPYPSVGALQNVILASVLSDAVVVLQNCAREPEIVELCNFLNLAGADIRGGGTDRIVVKGVKKLHEVRYVIRSDRIVAGTYLCMAAATRGSVAVSGIDAAELSALTQVLSQMGCEIGHYKHAAFLSAKKRLHALPLLKTMPYPGFPTDMQSQLMSVLMLAEGDSIIWETVFENRFRTAYELQKMKADIRVEETARRAFIRGRKAVIPAELHAPDLRGGAALAIAALAAEGESLIEGREYIERGYEDIAGVIQSLGGYCRQNG